MTHAILSARQPGNAMVENARSYGAVLSPTM
jgi:hypothetical protein